MTAVWAGRGHTVLGEVTVVAMITSVETFGDQQSVKLIG
jgi:hypothetical protein